MGREIRKVPPHWNHPTSFDSYGREQLQPMFDQDFAAAAAEWKTEFAKWESGERPTYCDGDDAKLEYWEWENPPPDRAYYRTWSDDEATWFQVWETVSEGTPVSPPFATEEELIAYLATHGDFWDQKRGAPAWGREAAERFVRSKWAPSLIVVQGETGTTVTEGKLA